MLKSEVFMEDENQSLDIKKKIAIPFVFLVILLIAAGCLYWCGMRYKVSKDAFIEGGHSISVASRVDGQVKEVFAQNDKLVNANSIILELNSDTYENDMAKLTARQNDLQNRLNSSKKLVSEIKPDYESASKSYNSLKSKLKTVEAEYTKSAQMYKEGIVSKQEYDQVLIDLTTIQGKVKNAGEKFKLVSARFLAADNDVKSLEYELKNLDKELAQAQYNLSNTKIYAPEDGWVSDLDINEGDLLKASQVFMTLNPKKVWIVANYKKIQFDNVENGQTVWIKLDSYPNKKFKGHIDSIVNSDKNEGMVIVKVLFDENLDEYDIRPGKSVVLKLRARG